MGLRSMVKTESCPVEVSQRLKRMITIVDKLGRQPTMALSKMQDIAGCRAVLNSIDQVRRVQKRLSKNRPPLKVYDYIAEPRPSGYRGVHVIVEYDGRPIEVQLRTRVMHAWAVTVERMGGRMDTDLKSGHGPPEVLALLQSISEAMAIEEVGGTVDAELMKRIDDLRSQAQPYLKGGGA
jgi:putative GTP pyrophosphokinase